ncbi:hypothetical protein [Streptomyces sp. NBC_01462]|uniref:hypothetical protein n=1 Tax=Streptomyces sp. NBC_01462 TaxID=2903876 RepID=UPI002E2ECFCC|nr:hypothetical protein [Streptomyces sp. NBC_01462]
MHIVRWRDRGEDESGLDSPDSAPASLSRKWWLVGASRHVWWEGVRTVLCVVETVAILADAQVLAVTARTLTAVGDTIADAGKPERS